MAPCRHTVPEYEIVRNHTLRVYRSEEHLPREKQLAWKIAAVASDPVAVEDDVTEMIINRIIDNASVAVAAGSERARHGHMSSP